MSLLSFAPMPDACVVFNDLDEGVVTKSEIVTAVQSSEQDGIWDLGNSALCDCTLTFALAS
jgi:hypothetical protein